MWFNNYGVPTMNILKVAKSVINSMQTTLMHGFMSNKKYKLIVFKTTIYAIMPRVAY